MVVRAPPPRWSGGCALCANNPKAHVPMALHSPCSSPGLFVHPTRGSAFSVERFCFAFVVPLHPYRFRDNIVGVIKGKVGLKRVQHRLEFLYSLDLQIEGEGLVLPSLEASISLHEGKVGLRLKVKVDRPPLRECKGCSKRDCNRVRVKMHMVFYV